MDTTTTPRGDRDNFPRDNDWGFLDGPHQEHVLVIGDRNEIHRGVSSNADSVAAHLAREHQRKTKNGARWLVLPLLDDRVANAAETMRQHQDLVEGTDLFVLMAGANDSDRLTPVAAWEEDLRKSLEQARDTLPKDARVVLSAIPELSGAGAFGFSRRRRHLRRLNRVLRSVASSQPRVTLSHAPAEVGMRLSRATTSDDFSAAYRVWAEAIHGVIMSA